MTNDLRRPLPEEVGILLASADQLPEIKGFFYVAAPYGHQNQAIIEQRMVEYEATDAVLSAIGHKTVSPLSKHTTLKYDKRLGGDFKFWEDYCLALLDICEAMVVILVDGWWQSKGVWAEIEHAQKNNIPIYFMYPIL